MVWSDTVSYLILTIAKSDLYFMVQLFLPKFDTVLWICVILVIGIMIQSDTMNYRALSPVFTNTVVLSYLQHCVKLDLNNS